MGSKNYEGNSLNSELTKKALEKVGNPNVLINLVSRRVRQLNSGSGGFCRPLIADATNLGAADISLREIIDEVGKDACRFFFALRTPDSHLNFDLELAKKQSSENPVYYVQYVHARICSIFRKAAETSLHPAGADLPMPNALYLTAPQERALLNKLAWFPEVLLDCEGLLSPHPLANYLMELAGLFHPFYEKCSVLSAQDPEVGKARLLLSAGVRDAIREGLDLLGVSAPEQM